MKSDLITIAIPYHKNPAYLQVALDSVAKQTLLPAEVIVIDNSIEGDAKTLMQHSILEIQYVRAAPDLGLAAYFNQCLDMAKTPWCVILHWDDIILPDYIESMSEAIARHPEAAGIFCKTCAIDIDGRPSFSFKDWGKQFFWPAGHAEMKLHGENSLAALLRANFIMCPTMCYNLPLLQNRRFSPRWDMLLDLDFYGHLLLEGQTLIGIPKVMYACRRHPSAASSIHEKNFSMFSEGVRCIDALANEAAGKGWHKAAGVGKRKIIYHLYVAFRTLCNLRPDNIRESLRFVHRYITGQN